MSRKWDIKGLTAREVETSRKLHGKPRVDEFQILIAVLTPSCVRPLLTLPAGPNELPAAKVESFWEKLKDNFNNPLIHILCVAVAITLLLAMLGYADWIEVSSYLLFT